jgi:hypothetical protein
VRGQSPYVIRQQRILVSWLVLAALAGCDNGSALVDRQGSGHLDDAGAWVVDNVGASCDVLTDAGANEGVYNLEALQCTSRICIKPVDYVGGVDTTAFCTATCAQDSDCVGLLRGDPKPDAQIDPRARTCVSGYACGIPFTKGSFCCRKLCVCKDFYGDEIPTPAACAADTAAANCM